MKLVGARTGSRNWDVEAAVTVHTGPIKDKTLEPTDFKRTTSHRIQSVDKSLDTREVESRQHTATESDHRGPARHGSAAHTTKSHSCPHLLSDAENERMNRKIDKLVAAIDDRRPIHFAPHAETGEVEIFADHGVTDQDDVDERERDIKTSPEKFRRIRRVDSGVRRMRDPASQRYADPTDSWTSTASERSSSNAWQRAIAAANVRFALANGGVDRVEIPVRQPFRSSPMVEARRGRRLALNTSPIPLDFHKPQRTSTPSIHSNGSEQDTSSPLFGKSCEQILRDTYAKPPGSTFQRESVENSPLDKFSFISGPRDVPSPQARDAKPPTSTGKAFGVFQDDSNPQSLANETAKSNLRSKVLKDVSNLRRPDYLQFNSFAKDTSSADNRAGPTVPSAASLICFGGATNSKSRRAYIKQRWPRLLDGRGNGSMERLPRLDGGVRRRNEQTIGRPIDASYYELSPVRTSVTDLPLAVDPIRQAHFDLALARLEGRALPPPSSPIQRHPDWAALHDRDVQIEGGYRPLPLYGPAPSRSASYTLRRGWWRYSR